MKRLIAAALAALLLLNCAACGNQKPENTAQSGEASAGLFAMDTYLNLTAYGEKAEAALEQAQERIRELERLLEQVDYTKISLEGAALTVPEGMQLDLGAVGKGYAADETAAVLRENGVTSALLDFGGNILTVGAKPDGSPWRVASVTRTARAIWACWS